MKVKGKKKQTPTVPDRVVLPLMSQTTSCMLARRRGKSKSVSLSESSFRF